MNFRPLQNHVVIKRSDSQKESKGGIIIPDAVQEKPQEGEVLAVGPGNRDNQGNLNPLDVSVGDTVLFNKWSGVELTIENEEVVVIRETEIVGIL